MIDFLKNIEKFESLKRVYENNLFTAKSIALEIGLWHTLSEEDKDKLENNTPLESYLNSGVEVEIDLDEQYTKLGYGEITQRGVETLYEFIKGKIDNEELINFCDVGSGNGKIVLHMAIISQFNSFIGLEIQKIRHLYSNWIKEKTLLNFNNVNFFNLDALDFDFSNVNFVFMNDLLFENKDIENILNIFKPGTHLISISENSLIPDDVIKIEVSWMKEKLPFKYYKIK
jgi:hypothetical protein